MLIIPRPQIAATARSLAVLLCLLCSLTASARGLRDYGMFIHFGPNTFQDIEWGDGTAPASVYNPTRLDCDQWVRVARDAGFRYVLLVTKHHDGFCLWDSRWTDYDVASSPVKTDVVGAVSKACRKYGLGFAVYYSLWDRHEPSYRSKDFGRYIDYMERQLTELLTNYGPVGELWLDGAWDKAVDDWQLPRLYSLVKRLQPQCQVGVNHTVAFEDNEQRYRTNVLPDSCDRDNKYYIRFFPSDFRLWDPKIAALYDAKRYLHNGRSYELPFEHTLCLSKAWTWFEKSRPMAVRELDELEELFYWTTSNGNSLVMDVPPGPEGLIRPHLADRVVALRQRLGIKDGRPVPKRPLSDMLSYRAHATATSVYPAPHGTTAARYATDGGMQTRWAAADTTATLTVDLGGEKTFSKIVIFEYQDTRGNGDGFTTIRTNRITAYTVDALIDGRWQALYVGDEPMGDCKVIRLARPCKAGAVRLNVLAATAPPSIYEFEVLK